VVQHHHLRDGDGMTEIIYQYGTVIMKDGKVGTNQGCCCDLCSRGECTVTLEFLDENECEDDVFDLYVVNPGTNAERFVQEVDLVASPAGSCQDAGATYADITIPLDLTLEDYSADCRVRIELRYKSANCCFTWTRFRLRRPDNTLLYGDYFDIGGISAEYTWDQLCGPPPPPPPPTPCCTILATCGGNNYWTCAGSERSCCEDAYPDTDCSGDDPAIIECDITDQATALSVPSQAPFDCLGGSHLPYINGAYIEVENWSPYVELDVNRADQDAATQALYDRVEELMNAAYLCEWECLADDSTVYSFSGPTVTSGGTTYNTVFSVTAAVDLCSRTAQLTVSETTAGLVSFFVATSLAALTAITPACNNYSACQCEPWSENLTAFDSDTNSNVANGTVQVGHTP